MKVYVLVALLDPDTGWQEVWGVYSSREKVKAEIEFQGGQEMEGYDEPRFSIEEFTLDGEGA